MVGTLESTRIRPLTVEEIPLCIPFGQAFHAEMQLPGAFLPDTFVKNWTTFLSQFPAVILGLFKDGALVGGISGMMTPDLFDARLTAQEFFWFMDAAHRSGTGAMRLLKSFEAWGKERGAVEMRMVHMVGKNDAQLERIYKKLGYRTLEVCYVKPLV